MPTKIELNYCKSLKFNPESLLDRLFSVVFSRNLDQQFTVYRHLDQIFNLRNYPIIIYIFVKVSKNRNFYTCCTNAIILPLTYHTVLQTIIT